MGYDAGQVFGGFAYSEDDLLSRSYRDSSLFRFLLPGYGAAARLNTATRAGQARSGHCHAAGTLNRLQKSRWDALLRRLRSRYRKCRLSSSRDADAALAGEAKAIAHRHPERCLLPLSGSWNSGQSTEAEAAALEVLLSLARGRGHERSTVLRPRKRVPISGLSR